MRNFRKRFAAAAVVMMLAGLLAGCGGEDKVGTVDMTRVEKESTQAKDLEKKIQDKQESMQKELDQAKTTMSAEDFQKKQAQSQQEFSVYGASMQRQFLSDIQTKLADIAKEKNVGIVVYKEAVPQGGIDVTDDLIKKMK